MKAGLNEDIPMFQTMMCPTSVLQKLCAVNPIGRCLLYTSSNTCELCCSTHPALSTATMRPLWRTIWRSPIGAARPTPDVYKRQP